MARFQVGNPGGPGRPPLDEAAKKTREIIREKLAPALPAILDRLLASKQPKLILESLKVLLPYLVARQSSVDLRIEQQEDVVERTFLEIQAERERRATAAAPSAQPPNQPT
jgi:hypothetical protein